MSKITLPQYAFSHSEDWKAAESILQAAIDAADPYRAVRSVLHVDDDRLKIGDQEYLWKDTGRVILIGAGKASVAMALAMADCLGDRLNTGALITKHLDPETIQQLPSSLKVLVGSHPVPDEPSTASTHQMLNSIQDLRLQDLVLCVISGGGSALMTLPVEGVPLDALQGLTRKLLASGASIDEINILRKHLDQIKGGGLARVVAPAKLVTLILSDVIGSPLSSIASGPTVADESTFQDAVTILAKYGLEDKIPSEISHWLQLGVDGKVPETVKPGDPILNRVQNLLVASNEQASQAAVQKAQEIGFQATVLMNDLQGEARQAGAQMAGILQEMALSGKPIQRPGMVVAGGETTVTIHGDGHGGRNQELALAAVSEIAGIPNAALITLATDGEDGPTDAAGAVVTGETLQRARQLGLDPQDFLARNDSYAFFEAVGCLIKTGPTGTNVNDLAFLFTFPEAD